MINFYQKLLGGFEISTHIEEWNMYKLGSTKIFNYYIIGILFCFTLYLYIPSYKEYTISLIGFLGLMLLLKFGEYKGYNEALHDLETDIAGTFQ